MPRSNPKNPRDRGLAHSIRLSDAAMRKLESILRLGATALRDKILDEALNRQAGNIQICGRRRFGMALEFQAEGALRATREVAVALGIAYRDARPIGFRLEDWYQACGLDKNGELYVGTDGT